MACADEIDFTTLLPASGIPSKSVLIFFIPGNPGLVEYYRQFLSQVKKRLGSDPSHQHTQYFIHGASLAGFDVSGSRKIPSSTEHLPLSLDAQVEDVYSRLEATAARVRLENGIQGDLPVVVMGHSIGAYMTLQVVAKWQEMAKERETCMKLSAGVCLFPTIFELDISPTGRQVGPLTKIPAFALIIHLIAKLLFLAMPISLATWLVQLITRMPAESAKITASFLKSKHGVQQALHMAKDELSQLTHDRWTDEFWGASSPTTNGSASSTTLAKSAVQPSSQSATRTQLHFYWGSDDHWIARETRDKIIATRARVEGRAGDELKPVMEIDGNGIGHAFCLSEKGNRVVAERCASWVLGLEFD